MTPRRTIQEVIDRVSLFDLKSYLNGAGWRRVPSESTRWEVHRLIPNADRSFELVIPARDEFVDVRARIASAVSALAQIESRPAEVIWKHLSGSNSDSLLIRLEVESDSSSIPLRDASRHVKAIRDLVLYGSCSEIEIRPHYEQPLPNAFGILDGFEFCHTYAGSFGFEVTSPIASKHLSLDIFNSPVRRRVLERIARGIDMLDIAVEKDSPEFLLESFSSGLNARMCDALIDIAGEEQTSFELGLEWATSLMPPADIREFAARKIGEADVSMLKFASEQLKKVEPHAQLVRGQVINLHCVRNPSEGAAKRTIEVKVNHPRWGLIDVKMSLGPTFYAAAIEAHAKGLQVEAAGQLQRAGNTWSLDALSSFVALGS